MPLFLKGYRLDNSKIADVLKLDPADAVYYQRSIINCLPRASYRYIGNGFQEGNKLNIMIVVDSGADADALMQTPMPVVESKTLAGVARDVCTAGVWPCFDDIDDLRTFWEDWAKSGGCRLGAIDPEHEEDLPSECN